MINKNQNNTLTTKYLASESYKKFELINCPQQGHFCKNTLSVINTNYLNYIQKLEEKDYHGALNSLKAAFLQTKKIQNPSCIKCSTFFRSTIIDSIEYIFKELRRMSFGFFSTNRFMDDYLEVKHTLEKFQKKC